MSGNRCRSWPSVQGITGPWATASNLTAPEYQEAKKDTDVIERHDPTQFAWIENGGTTGMLRVEMFMLSNFLLHTPEYDGTISTPEEFHAKGRGWVRAMIDTLFAPRFTDASGTNVRLAKLGDGLHVTVDDADENLAPGVRESVQVVVRDAASGDAETVTLVETGFDTGIFRNESPLTTSPLKCLSTSKSSGSPPKYSAWKL